MQIKWESRNKIERERKFGNSGAFTLPYSYRSFNNKQDRWVELTQWELVLWDQNSCQSIYLFVPRWARKCHRKECAAGFALTHISDPTSRAVKDNCHQACHCRYGCRRPGPLLLIPVSTRRNAAISTGTPQEDQGHPKPRYSLRRMSASNWSLFFFPSHSNFQVLPAYFL